MGKTVFRMLLRENYRTQLMSKDRNNPEHSLVRPDCPRCGSNLVKPIVYGFVDVGEYLELGKRIPDFELGGLETREENWCCAQCGHKWAAS